MWGLVTNGRTLRLLRNSTYLRRQAYVECDLAQILDEQRFADFAALYRLIHRTRLPHTAGTRATAGWNATISTRWNRADGCATACATAWNRDC